MEIKCGNQASHQKKSKYGVVMIVRSIGFSGVPSCRWTIGSVFIRILASQIAQNHFFGNFAVVKNEQAIFVSDYHFRPTNSFLS